MLLTLVSWPRRGRNCTGSRTEPKPQLTEEQWILIADLFPTPEITRLGGRPRVESRRCLEGVLWVLRSGARWKDLPTRFPSSATCWRRLKEWTESGTFEQAWARLLGKLDGLRHLHWDEALADGTFSPAKKGAPRSARPSAAREPRSCSWSTAKERLWLSKPPVPARRKSRGSNLCSIGECESVVRNA